MSIPRLPRPARAQATSGFPSPAAESAEASLDVRDLLVRRPATTFYLRMRGDAQIASGVFAGDVLIVDRALTPTPGSLVIVTAGGELRVSRWRARASGSDHDADDADDPQAATIWGVVTYVIHPADALPGDRSADALDIE